MVAFGSDFKEVLEGLAVVLATVGHLGAVSVHATIK